MKIQFIIYLFTTKKEMLFFLDFEPITLKSIKTTYPYHLTKLHHMFLKYFIGIIMHALCMLHATVHV